MVALFVLIGLIIAMVPFWLNQIPSMKAARFKPDLAMHDAILKELTPRNPVARNITEATERALEQADGTRVTFKQIRHWS